MAGASINHWHWLRRPDITIKDGVLIAGEAQGEWRQENWYRPGEHTKAILTAIQLVKDEETAQQFVNDWGLLGLEYKDTKRRSDMFRGAVDYALGIRGKTYDDYEDYKEIVQGILKHFGVKNLQDLTQPRETAQDIIEFARYIRDSDILKIKFLLNLYQDDPYAAEHEAETWLNSLTSEKFQEAIGFDWDIDSLREGHKRYEHSSKVPFYEYVLNIGLSSQRHRFNHSAERERGIWIELYTSSVYGRTEGSPVYHFDGLFRFIEYTLLADPALLPQRCADPKCEQLFFPSRKGQAYCPPPQGIKRSRCEQRHNKEKRRVRLKALAAPL